MAPGLDHDRVPAGVEAEWVSVGGSIVEALLWGRAPSATWRRATVVVDAPGYCTESRSFQLSPGEEQRWELAMRERPLVGEC